MVFSPPQLKSLLSLTDDEYFLLCQANPDLRIEHNSSGDLMIMSSTGGEIGHRNIEVAFQVQSWSRTNDLGVVLKNPETLSGEDVLPGFVLDLKPIFADVE